MRDKTNKNAAILRNHSFGSSLWIFRWTIGVGHSSEHSSEHSDIAMNRVIRHIQLSSLQCGPQCGPGR